MKNALTFHCSEHGPQDVDNVSVGIIFCATPVRVTLKCGCAWLWNSSNVWEQQTMTNGLHELSRQSFSHPETVNHVTPTKPWSRC